MNLCKNLKKNLFHRKLDMQARNDMLFKVQAWFCLVGYKCDTITHKHHNPSKNISKLYICTCICINFEITR